MRKQLATNDLYLLYDIDENDIVINVESTPIMIISVLKADKREVLIMTHMDENGELDPDKITYIEPKIKLKSKNDIESILNLFINVQSIEELKNFVELL